MQRYVFFLFAGGLLLVLAWVNLSSRVEAGGQKLDETLDWQLPNEKYMLDFKDQVPIYFVNRSQNIQEWLKLSKFWNETTETVPNPRTGDMVTRKAIKIKLPLGLSRNPTVPLSNEMTLHRWYLGKKLYFDHILSSDSTVACASCHSPKLGWTDQQPVSTGIGGKKGGVSAPTVLNSAYNPLQFWDGRAVSLEDQAQGPVGNPLEMFGEKGHAWNKAVLRVRAKKGYVDAFKYAYGTEPTRDTIAKAIAVYERTVFSGNSIHDRAVLAMQLRFFEEGKTATKLEPEDADYAKVLEEAFTAKDTHSLTALGLDPAKDQGKIPVVSKSLANGIKVFFGKARCNSCHVGDNFTDDQFHNLGVGVKDGKIPADSLGRYGAMPVGDKNPAMVGAFKTPTLRGLTSTGPYMHDGSEKTLEEVVEFYNKGGNPNRYLDVKMRDFDAEKAYILSKKNNTPYKGPKIFIFGPDETPVVPLALNLSDQEKKDLVLVMRALEGDLVDPIVADPETMPPILSASGKE